ncbi:MAG: UDP-N-acetylmuramate dehydrogenase [Myxococcota bacterium]
MIETATRHALEEALGDAVAFDVPMTRHTSLRIGGLADALATPSSREQIGVLLSLCAEHGLPHWTIGAGFNCLVSDAGIDGVVIKLGGLRALEVRPDTAVFAEAGVTHASLTRFCVEHGLAGLEFGAGIPGVVGGWIPMNAGIGSREVKDVVLSIEVIEPGAGARSLPRDALDFQYRALRGLAPGAVVVAALFEVTPSSSETVRAEVDRLLAQRAGSQPLNVPSCGSVFKNPEGDFAGRLIEAAGLKGKRSGGAQISEVHANFIANAGGATAADVRRLMELAQEAVEKEAGIQLEPEVRLIGRQE